MDADAERAIPGSRIRVSFAEISDVLYRLLRDGEE